MLLHEVIGVKTTFIRDSVPHVRFLFALPLQVFADWIIDPYMTAIVKHFQVSDLLPKDAKPLYSKALEQLIRRAGPSIRSREPPET